MSKGDMPFQPQHALEFRVEICSGNVHRAVSLVQCLFCVHSGSEDRDGSSVKCWCTVNIQFYKRSFSKENYSGHNERQHFVEWEAYISLTNKAKKSYFVNKKKSIMDTFLDSSDNEFHFKILASIVENIMDAFFHPEDEEDDYEAITMRNALKLFSKQPNWFVICED
uniref:Uncharacterized protein n=1 Tax=Physcomitrium patens TaxID=3218 RepID=A0A2K1K0D6_PHYPA|nr:hypothetical protein PHYPA_014374 [Physcomitrium patens]